MGIHYNTKGKHKADLLDYIKNKDIFKVDKDGYIPLLNGYGLCIDIDEETVRKAAKINHN